MPDPAKMICPECHRVSCLHSCTECGGAWKFCLGTDCDAPFAVNQRLHPTSPQLNQRLANSRQQNQIDPRYTGPSVVLNEINMLGDYVLTGGGHLLWIEKVWPYLIVAFLGYMTFAPDTVTILRPLLGIGCIGLLVCLVFGVTKDDLKKWLSKEK